jgi:hypothetical protein
VRRGAVAFIVVTPLCLGMADCETHQCDTSVVAMGGDAGPIMGSTLQMIGDQMIWRSSPNEGPWLDFLGNRTFVFTYPEPFACEVPAATVYLAGDPKKPNASFISGGAGLAPLMQNLPDEGGLYRGITITNSTCAPYGLQLVVTGTPVGAPCLVQIFDAGEGGSGQVAGEGGDEPSDAGVDAASE